MHSNAQCGNYIRPSKSVQQLPMRADPEQPHTGLVFPPQGACNCPLVLILTAFTGPAGDTSVLTATGWLADTGPHLA